MAAGGVPFRMEWVACDVERLHFGSADLDTLPVRSACRAHVAAISSTANRSVRGRLRQVCRDVANRGAEELRARHSEDIRPGPPQGLAQPVSGACARAAIADVRPPTQLCKDAPRGT
jgi:hypothetical protein